MVTQELKYYLKKLEKSVNLKIKQKDMIEGSRKGEVVFAKSYIAAQLRKFGFSLTEIAKILFLKNHASVIHLIDLWYGNYSHPSNKMYSMYIMLEKNIKIKSIKETFCKTHKLSLETLIKIKTILKPVYISTKNSTEIYSVWEINQAFKRNKKNRIIKADSAYFEVLLRNEVKYIILDMKNLEDYKLGKTLK